MVDGSKGQGTQDTLGVAWNIRMKPVDGDRTLVSIDKLTIFPLLLSWQPRHDHFRSRLWMRETALSSSICTGILLV